MDRAEFFSMAQKATVYTGDFKDLAKPVEETLLVVFKEIKYYPRSIEIGYKKSGKVKNTAILHDLKVNALVYADLERVSKYEP
jgi:hypothetical protein